LILPDPKRQGDIKFIFAKGFPYKIRLATIIILYLIGFSIQLYLNFFIGLLFIVTGTFIGLVQGYSDVERFKDKKEEWSRVTLDAFEKIKTKARELKKWDTDAFDISNGLGIFVFIVFIIIFIIIAYNINSFSANSNLFLFLAIDAAVIFIPQWFSGIKTYLKNDALISKINFLDNIVSLLTNANDVNVIPMLALKEAVAGGKVPADARLLINFKDQPEVFMGMQVQITTNTVQGTDYPYLYCVLIAKKGSGILKKYSIQSGRYRELKLSVPKNVDINDSGSKDVDVLVIRQTTTADSGYHTNMFQARSIVNCGLDVSRSLLKDISTGKIGKS